MFKLTEMDAVLRVSGILEQTSIGKILDELTLDVGQKNDFMDRYASDFVHMSYMCRNTSHAELEYAVGLSNYIHAIVYHAS